MSVDLLSRSHVFSLDHVYFIPWGFFILVTAMKYGEKWNIVCRFSLGARSGVVRVEGLGMQVEGVSESRSDILAVITTGEPTALENLK